MARSGCLLGEMLPGKLVLGTAPVDTILLLFAHAGISILMGDFLLFLVVAGASCTLLGCLYRLEKQMGINTGGYGRTPKTIS